MASKTAHVDPLDGFKGYVSKSFTFKKVDALELKLDVLYPSDEISSMPRNVVMHIHGGFLVSSISKSRPSLVLTQSQIAGDRYSYLPYWLINASVSRG